MPRAADLDRHPWLQVYLVAHAEPVQKRQVGGAAPQEDVLAVVDVELAPPEGVGEPAQPRPRLEQQHVVTGVGAPQRRGDPRQASPDHRDPHGHADLANSARAATDAFCFPDRDKRRSYTRDGSAAMRTSRCR